MCGGREGLAAHAMHHPTDNIDAAASGRDARTQVIDRLRSELCFGLLQEVMANRQSFAAVGAGSAGMAALVFTGLMYPVVCAKHWYRNMLLAMFVVAVVFFVGLFAFGAVQRSNAAQSIGPVIVITAAVVGFPILVFRSLALRRYGKHVKKLRAIIRSEGVTTHEWDAVSSNALRNPDMRHVRDFLEGLRDDCIKPAEPIESSRVNVTR